MARLNNMAFRNNIAYFTNHFLYQKQMLNFSFSKENLLKITFAHHKCWKMFLNLPVLDIRVRPLHDLMQKTHKKHRNATQKLLFLLFKLTVKSWAPVNTR